MKIELSKNEVKLIDEALRVWENEPTGSCMSSSLMAAIFCPKDQQGNFKEHTNKMLDEAQDDSSQRRRIATLLRAKLFQAEAVNSEFEIEA